MRHALCPDWIPPAPARRAPAEARFLARLQEAGLAASLAVALSWSVAELTLLLLG